MKIIKTIYKLNNNLNKKIVLISDLHFNDKRDISRLNNILTEIRKIKPNYICIPGDIINRANVHDPDIIIEWLEKLSKICKVIISLGNHEFYINQFKKMYGLNKDFIEKVSKIENLYLLDNNNIVIDSINFIGITIPMEYYDEKHIDGFEKYLNKLNFVKDKYNILLCHSPMNICKKEVLNNKNIDLVLCGHMHGGVVPKFLRILFRHRGLVSPKKKLFPKNAYGHVKIENTDVIITSGTRVLPRNKFSNIFKPEIVQINF